MHHRENELDADAEYDVDGGLELYESRSKRGHQVGRLQQWVSLITLCHAALRSVVHSLAELFVDPWQAGASGQSSAADSRGVLAGVQAKAARRERAAQVADARRITSALDRCQLCFSSAARRRNLTLAIGQSAYLALPSRRPHPLADMPACLPFADPGTFGHAVMVKSSMGSAC